MLYEYKENPIRFGYRGQFTTATGIFEVIVEPHSRTLKINNEWLKLPLPRMIFIIKYLKIDGTYNFDNTVDFAKVFISIMNDKLVTDCPLPNSLKSQNIVPELGWICFGEELVLTDAKPKGLINKILTEYFCSAFATVIQTSFNGPSQEYYRKWAETKQIPHYLYPSKNYQKIKDDVEKSL
jgi:hypothetical protein